MAKQIPLVRIKYAWLLSGSASVIMNEKYGDGTPLGTSNEYVKIAQKYEEWWRPFNDRILNGICDILNLEFSQNIIDVYMAPWFSPISDPMVIPPIYRSPDMLINTVTHELIHRLLTDNTSVAYGHNFVSDWKALFGDHHEWKTIVHIPVHAVMKKLYLDVLNRPDLLALDIEKVEKNKPYRDAWTYVNTNDYVAIIDKLSVSKA